MSETIDLRKKSKSKDLFFFLSIGGHRYDRDRGLHGTFILLCIYREIPGSE